MTDRALLVGVDTYPDPRNNLNSCVADTLAFKQVLQQTYGFPPASIRLLHNLDATVANVLAGLEDLFAGAQPGDHLFFFQSSHGWQYPEGDTMVEVLCLYDDFLTDTELVQRTQRLPQGVLTVGIDACHAGGMNKVFFPAGDVQVARAKVWQPSAEQERVAAQLYGQVTRFKFFGHSATGDTGAVAKSFSMNPKGVAPAKDFAAGAPDLNGAVFAACQADQTAAAGSPATNNLSAFTYAVLQELDTSISLAELQARTAARLDDLNMSQVPRAVAPAMQPGLLSTAFITGRQVAGSGPRPPIDGDAGGGQDGGGFDPLAYLREQLGMVSR